MAQVEIIAVMRKLAAAKNAAAKAEKEAKELEEILKREMSEQGVTELVGGGFKATVKDIVSERLDSKALKAEYAEIAALFMKASISQRFSFGVNS